jgi:hypothetical protein
MILLKIMFEDEELLEMEVAAVEVSDAGNEGMRIRLGLRPGDASVKIDNAPPGGEE